MRFTVAIIGRPNVGKSTLFNRLVGKRLAIVDEMPGVTRDRREGEARLADLSFRVIDTAGFEDAADESLEGRMREQTERALAVADAALLMIDGRAGVTPVDAHFSRWLRKKTVPVILIVNKCESSAGEAGLADSFSLGLGDPVALSAEHGQGLSELYERLRPLCGAGEEAAPREERESGEGDEESEGEAAGEVGERPLRLAIIGRPNVGKSTLVNRLLGDERLLTGPEPGITRDAIAVEWTHDGRAIQLVDTAGLRRRPRVAERIEKKAVLGTEQAIRFAHVVVLVMDACSLLERQDLAIARNVAGEGRALVVAVNKWDLVRDRSGTLARLGARLEDSLPQVRGVPCVTFSALTGHKVKSLMPAVIEAYDTWNRRVPTSRLNDWLSGVVAHHPPPASAGRRPRLRYMTQVKARPPTFVLFANRPAELPETYLRYLVNGLRQAFDLPGTPIRIHLRKGRNPYARE